jgi:hypothetical protein
MFHGATSYFSDVVRSIDRAALVPTVADNQTRQYFSNPIGGPGNCRKEESYAFL